MELFTTPGKPMLNLDSLSSLHTNERLIFFVPTHILARRGETIDGASRCAGFRTASFTTPAARSSVSSQLLIIHAGPASGPAASEGYVER